MGKFHKASEDIEINNTLREQLDVPMEEDSFTERVHSICKNLGISPDVYVYDAEEKRAKVFMWSYIL